MNSRSHPRSRGTSIDWCACARLGYPPPLRQLDSRPTVSPSAASTTSISTSCNSLIAASGMGSGFSSADERMSGAISTPPPLRQPDSRPTVSPSAASTTSISTSCNSLIAASGMGSGFSSADERMSGAISTISNSRSCDIDAIIPVNSRLTNYLIR